MIFQSNNIEINYVRGHRYVGGFIGDETSKLEWILPKIETWKKSIQKLSIAAKLYPQSAYTSFTHCLQSQWYHLCRTTPNISEHLQPLEDEINNNFLQNLFSIEKIDPTLQTLIYLPIKLGGLNIYNPTEIADTAYLSSTSAT